MPRRWIVDGMNVIGARPDGWWNDPDEAMRAFTVELDRFSAATGDPVTVVFDRRPRHDPPSSETVTVVFARRKGRNAADHEIEVLTEDDEEPRSLSIVTSDKRLADKVKSLGAPVVGAGAFVRRLAALG